MTTPGPVAVSKSHEETGRRAARFFERRRFGEWTGADQAELDAWLVESTLHRVAYLRVEWSFSRAEHLAMLGPVEPRPGASRAGDKFQYRRFMLPLLAAASIVLAATVGATLFLHSAIEPPVRMFATNVGGRSVLKFGDGTEMYLNTNTAIRYRMSTDQRIVWLDRGEVYFRVTHNAANPFAVVAGGHRITDLGTEFLVRDDAGGLDVALVKGRAQLASENPGSGTATLAPGDEAVATQMSMIITKKTQRQLSDELSWRQGVLVFRKTRLADVVREFNRYNTTRLVIADPSIADVEITAEIKTDRFDDLLSLVQTVLNFRANHEGNDILISRGQRDETKRAVSVKHSP
jgi:transmembrane sensor